MSADAIKDIIYQAASQAISSDAVDTEAEVLQSTIGLVHTLIVDGHLAELALMLSVNFPAYFTTSPPLGLYPPINAN